MDVNPFIQREGGARLVGGTPCPAPAFAFASFLTGETVPRRLRLCKVTWIVASRGQGVNMLSNDVRRPVVGGVGSSSFTGL